MLDCKVEVDRQTWVLEHSLHHYPSLTTFESLTGVDGGSRGLPETVWEVRARGGLYTGHAVPGNLTLLLHMDFYVVERGTRDETLNDFGLHYYWNLTTSL